MSMHTNRPPALFIVDDETNKLCRIYGAAEKAAAGDFVFNHGELCRLVNGRHDRLQFWPVASEAILDILSQFVVIATS